MRPKSIYNVLMFSLAVSVLGFVAVLFLDTGLPSGWESSKAIYCGGKKVLIQKSELYNYEKNRYTELAQSYKIYLSNGNKLRVIFDYFQSKDLVDQYEYQIALFNIDHKPASLKDFYLEFEGMQANSIDSEDIVIDVGGAKVINITTNIKTESGASWRLVASSGGECLFKLTGIFGDINQQKKSNSNMGVAVGSESGFVSVPPGLSPIGFADWRTVKPFADLGIRVLSFNREKLGTWSRIDSDPRALFEPGIAYYLENPSNIAISVRIDEPYKVPLNIQSHSLRTGWNLFYNDSGKDISISDYQVIIGSPDFARRSLESKKWLVSDLKDQNLVHDKVYIVPKLQDDKNDLTERGVSDWVRDGDIFWVFLFREPHIERIFLPELDMDFKADKDSYAPGEKIRLNYKITNNSQNKYSVDGENQNDPCMYGFAVLKGSDALYSSVPPGITSCPSWPEQIDLQAGSVIEYNQTWEVPKNISGQIRIVGYFDQSRVFSKDMKLKQVMVNIKEDE